MLPPRPSAAPAAWMPAAWDVVPAASSATPLDTADEFVSGWDVTAASSPSTGASTGVGRHGDVFDLLPDFGAVSAMRDARDAGEQAWAALVAAAADEREAQVRLELEAAYAAADAEREAAHAEALDATWAEGHAEGCAAGAAQARAALVDAVGALDAAVGEVRAHEERWMGDLRAHVAALAVAVARHVVEREIAADDGLVVALAARAVAEFPAQEALVARVHPDDLGALKAAWADAGHGGGGRQETVRWAPDARVARGGVLVEGRERIVDGRVDAALERLYRALAGHVA